MSDFSSEIFQFLEVKFSICLNRRVFVMTGEWMSIDVSPVKYSDSHSAPLPCPFLALESVLYLRVHTPVNRPGRFCLKETNFVIFFSCSVSVNINTFIG